MCKSQLLYHIQTKGKLSLAELLAINMYANSRRLVKKNKKKEIMPRGALGNI